MGAVGEDRRQITDPPALAPGQGEGSEALKSSATVGTTSERSNTPSPRIATGLGPGTSPGTQARPIKVPAVPSPGSAACGVR